MISKIKKFFALFFVWKVPIATPAELADAAAIITHEFGNQHTVSKATEQIVLVGAAIHKQYGKKPMVCQFPGNTVAIKNGIIPVLVIRKVLLPDKTYLDTEEVNRQLAAFCKEYENRYVVVCTHPHHAWRAGENLRHHGLIPVFPDLSSVHYDSECSRKSVASRWFFIPREILVRIKYYYQGYLDY